MNYESFKYSSEEGIGHLVLNKGEDLNIYNETIVYSFHINNIV